MQSDRLLSGSYRQRVLRVVCYSGHLVRLNESHAICSLEASVVLTAKRCDVLFYPEQPDPLVLETIISVDLWLIACEKAENIETISDVYPDL